MTTQKIEIEIDGVPDGYELTGEFKVPLKGEFYLTNSGKLFAIESEGNLTQSHYHILKPTPSVVLDAELKSALEYIESECTNSDSICPFDNGCGDFGKYVCCIGDSLRDVWCDISGVLKLRNLSKKCTDLFIKHRDKIIKAAEDHKKQRKQAEIEKERKRVVGKWCLVWDTHEYRARTSYVSGFNGECYSAADNKSSNVTNLWKNATPLTDTQLTELGLENGD